jgi:hypothetical protein
VRLRNCSNEVNAWGANKPLIKTLVMRTEIHGGYPTMNAGTRQVLEVAEQTRKRINSSGDRRANMAAGENAEQANGGAVSGRRPRVFVAAENRLLREALSRMLIKSGEIEVVGMEMAEPFQMDDLLKEEAEILLL